MFSPPYLWRIKFTLNECTCNSDNQSNIFDFMSKWENPTSSVSITCVSQIWTDDEANSLKFWRNVPTVRSLNKCTYTCLIPVRSLNECTYMCLIPVRSLNECSYMCLIIEIRVWIVISLSSYNWSTCISIHFRYEKKKNFFYTKTTDTYYYYEIEDYLENNW